MRLLILLFLLPAVSVAQVPHTFNNGEVADAEKMNENFDSLAGNISALELRIAPEHLISEAVDCSADPAALNKSLSQNSGVHRLELNVSGECLLDESTQALQLRYRSLFINGDTASTTTLSSPSEIRFQARTSAVLSLTNITLSAPQIRFYIANHSSGVMTDVSLAAPEDGLPFITHVIAANQSVVLISGSAGKTMSWKRVTAQTNSRISFLANIDPAVQPEFYVADQSSVTLRGQGVVGVLNCENLSYCLAFNYPNVTGSSAPLITEQLSITYGSVFRTFSNPSCDLAPEYVAATYSNRTIHSGGQHYIQDRCNPDEPPQTVQ